MKFNKNDLVRHKTTAEEFRYIGKANGDLCFVMKTTINKNNKIIDNVGFSIIKVSTYDLYLV